MLQKITKALSGDPKKVRLADWEVIFTSVYNNIYCRVGKGIYIFHPWISRTSGAGVLKD